MGAARRRREALVAATLAVLPWVLAVLEEVLVPTMGAATLFAAVSSRGIQLFVLLALGVPLEVLARRRSGRRRAPLGSGTVAER